MEVIMLKVGVIVFSPTGTTAKNCKTIAKAIPEAEVDMLNITLPAEREKLMGDTSAIVASYDRLVFGVPVYAGKVPAFVQNLIKDIPGEGKSATAVVVYGNRDYGIALLRLTELLNNKGFVVDSAGAYIGQHSYSDLMPVAVGRPDSSDTEEARQFGKKITTGLQPLKESDIPIEIDMLSKSDSEGQVFPFYDEKKCVECGTCAEHCPTGIIRKSTGKYISEDVRKNCIGCTGCIKACPNGARKLKPSLIQRMMLKMVLGKSVKLRREPFYVIGS
jgi:ferredoxin